MNLFHTQRYIEKERIKKWVRESEIVCVFAWRKVIIWNGVWGVYVEVKPIWTRRDGDKSHVQKEVNLKCKKNTIGIGLLHGFHWLYIHFVCRRLLNSFTLVHQLCVQRCRFSVCNRTEQERERERELTGTHTHTHTCSMFQSYPHSSKLFEYNAWRALECTFRRIEKEKRVCRRRNDGKRTVYR